MVVANRTGSIDVKLIDFGLAKRAGMETLDASRITLTRDFVGSPAFSSPEQCQTKRFDVRSDILPWRQESGVGKRDSLVKIYVNMVPLGRLDRAEEVASAALFLASDDSSYMTGADLMNDVASAKSEARRSYERAVWCDRIRRQSLLFRSSFGGTIRRFFHFSFSQEKSILDPFLKLSPGSSSRGSKRLG
jgi:serine/threonine protein kinase